MSTQGAVVVGGYVNGVGLVRALAARGIPTAVITTHSYDLAHHSRCVAGHDAAPDLGENPEQLLEVLARHRAEWAGWALIPANDEALTALALQHDRLSSAHPVLAPRWEVARELLDKSRSNTLARAVGVALPHDYGTADATTAERSDLRFPLLVKPDLSHRFRERFGVKLFVARDRKELGHAIARIAEAGLSGRVIDWIPGGDEQIHVHCVYIDRRGEPSEGLTVRKIRQSPPFFGVARVAEIAEPQPGLREATIEMLRRVGFHGIAAAEFKLDPRDGTYRLLEINGRSVIFNGLLRRAGLDLGWLAWSDQVQGARPAARTNEWRGVWINLHADVLHSMLRRDPSLSVRDFLAPYARPTTYAVWSARDPKPFAVQWARSGAAVASALRARVTRPLRVRGS